MNEEWQSFLAKHPESNFLQSPSWAETNKLIGHKIVVKVFEKNTVCLMIIKDARRGRFLEIPGGPLIDWSNKKLVQEIFTEIKKIAKENHCVFVRFRPQLPDTQKNRDILKNINAKPALMHLHAQNTVILDLTVSEDELLAKMRRQTRYEVRRSEKMGIVVEENNSDTMLTKFHAVQTSTAERQHFIPPTKKTLIAEKTAFGDDFKLYIAKTPENKPIAYGLILKDVHEAAYFEAASTELNHKFPGAYALLWKAIREAKQSGCKRFNLWGIAPPNSPNHRYAGVTTFKTGFGGEVVNFIPAHDIVINRPKYLFNTIIETVRKKRRHL